MKSTLTLFIFCLLLTGYGCTSEAAKMEDQIAEMEAALEEQADPQTATELIAAYDRFVRKNPDNSGQNSRYLYRAATVLYRMDRFAAATERLNQAIRDYPQAENTPSNILLLAAIYDEKLRMPAAGLTAYQAFAQAYPDHESLPELAGRLTADLPALPERLQEMRRNMYDDATGRIDFRMANNFITSAELYAGILPDDPRSPEFLHLAGETARATNDFEKAMAMYEWVSRKYPDHARASQALFLRAFILDNDLKRPEEARVLYEAFLEKYPEDDFADDTQFLLDNLGKDDEEIINSFLKEQGEEEEKLEQ